MNRVVRHSWYASPSRIASRQRSISAAYSAGSCRPTRQAPVRVGGRRRVPERGTTSSSANAIQPRRRARPPTRGARRGRTRRSARTRSHCSAGHVRSRRRSRARPRGRRHPRSRASRPTRRGSARHPTRSRDRRRVSGADVARVPARPPARPCRPSSSPPAASGPASSQKQCCDVRPADGEDGCRILPALERHGDRAAPTCSQARAPTQPL